MKDQNLKNFLFYIMSLFKIILLSGAGGVCWRLASMGAPWIRSLSHSLMFTQVSLAPALDRHRNSICSGFKVKVGKKKIISFIKNEYINRNRTLDLIFKTVVRICPG